jgi:hypothetical protein
MRKIIIICVILVLAIAGAVLLFGKKAEEKDNLESAIEPEQVVLVRLPEAEGREIQLGKEEWKKLNVFFSNFPEVFLYPFSEGEITNDELLRFGIAHNYLNNPNLIEEFSSTSGRLSAKYVEASIKKYFGIAQVIHHSIDWHDYKDGYYSIRYASGEAYCFSQVTKLIDVGEGDYVAYVNEYIASSGFTGDPHGTESLWEKHEENPPDLRLRARAIIRKVNEDGKSRYVLLEYLFLEEDDMEPDLPESSATPREVAADDQLEPVILQFIDEMQIFGNNKDQIVETLGAPLGQKTHEEPGPQAYACTILEYEGLRIQVWSDLMHDQYVNYMSLSSKKYVTRFGIGVGSSVEKVVELLGEPTKKEQGLMTYIYDMAVTDGVIRFHIANNIITEVEWDIGII